MKILLVNDDGYQSGGLLLLTNKLAECGHEVYVVAPDSQRSAFSHSASVFKNVNFVKLDEYGGAKCAYITSGTPADCVKFGVRQFSKLDLVISGPNNGENAGHGILYSGTVAGAEEGVLCGVNSIALSRVGYGGPFGSCVEYIAENVEKLASFCRPNIIINVNVPALPMAEIKGVRVCKMCLDQLFNDYFRPTDDKTVWYGEGNILDVTDTDSDVYLCGNGYVTITPLAIDRTCRELLDELRVLEK